MPQAVIKNNEQLCIRLDRADRTYMPGETVAGHIVRKSHIVTPNATVSISLHARAKSRMVTNRGHMTSTYRGRFDLVKAAKHTQTIFQGPLHISVDSGEQLWSFSVQLPTHVDLSALGTGVTQEQSFVPLDTIDDPSHGLPPTFLTACYQTLSGMSAFIEYVLQAELKSSSRSSASVADAVLPFRLLHLNPQPPDPGSPLRTSHHAHSISSENLLTGASSVASRQIDDVTSTNPTLAFDVQVQTPTVLLINSPDPVPFFVSAIPDLAKSSSNVQHSSHEILVTQIAMQIVAATEVKCLSRKSTRQAKGKLQIDLSAGDALRQYPNSLLIPWDTHTVESHASGESVHTSNRTPSEPLNIGAEIGLRLGQNPDLYPTFKTYNIHHTHRLKWSLEAQISGETWTLSGEDDVWVSASAELERSTAWIRPPEDRLPSFLDHHDESALGEDRRGLRQSGGVGGLSRLWDF